jgi:adenylate kinase
MNIILFGPPAAGKGTQSKALIDQGMIHISTGDLLRAEVKSGSARGAEIDALISKGNLVPDAMVNQLVADRLAPGVDFLFDGYPRTVEQAKFLDAELAKHGSKVDLLVNIEVDFDILRGRIAKRFAEQGRSDDNPEAFETRLAAYQRDTAAVLPHYAEQGVVKPVDGTLDIRTLKSVILTIIGWH